MEVYVPYKILRSKWIVTADNVGNNNCYRWDYVPESLCSRSNYSIFRGEVFPLLPTDLRVAHIFLWVLQIPHKTVCSLLYPLGSQQTLTGLSIALERYFPKHLPPSFILVKSSSSIYLTSASNVLTLYWFGAGVSNLRTFAKLGNWNMLEQELLKSFFETRRDGIVYVFAAGYLEIMVSNRARCKDKTKGISTLI